MSTVRSFPFSMSEHTGKTTPVDLDFTLRRVFGKANFRYLLCLFLRQARCLSLTEYQTISARDYYSGIRRA